MGWTKILLAGDALAYGDFMFKQPARVASTANIALTTGTLLTIDGIALAAGDRVLVKDQTTGSQNGIYAAATGAWARTTDADASGEVKTGLTVVVEQGTVSADTSWRLTTDNPITLDTTALVFARSLDKLSGTAPNTIEPDDTASAGTAVEASRQDHEHAIVAATPTGNVAASATAAEGTATSFVRSDHVHGCPVTWAATAHLLGGHTADTLANLNAKVSDATLDDITATRTPTANSVGNSQINNTATDIAFAQVILTPAATGTGTTEGTLFYDSDDNHLYVYVV